MNYGYFFKGHRKKIKQMSYDLWKMHRNFQSSLVHLFSILFLPLVMYFKIGNGFRVLVSFQHSSSDLTTRTFVNSVDAICGRTIRATHDLEIGLCSALHIIINEVY